MTKSIAELAKEIFAVVEHDLRDRRGIRHEWEMVDKDIQEEIRITNQLHIEEILKANNNNEDTQSTNIVDDIKNPNKIKAINSHVVIEHNIEYDDGRIGTVVFDKQYTYPPYNPLGHTVHQISDGEMKKEKDNVYKTQISILVERV